MKKTLTILLTLIMILGTTCLAVSADEGVKVRVSIADGSGKLVVARELVSVSDLDEDGAITISDALEAAHAAFYPYGADEGYGTFMSDYGLSLGKLWGEENGGSYGYYVNNASAWSLADPVSEGDHVYAFVYTDLVAWSDTFSWFDVDTVAADEGEEITLTLKAAGYDADWNPVESVVEGAEITVDGEGTGIFTDENGQATIAIEDSGKAVISAVSDTMTLVPPICVAEVGSADDVVVEVTAAADTLPNTGVASTFVFVGCGLALVAAGIVVLSKTRKEQMTF